MPNYRVGFNRPTLQAVIVNDGDPIPEGFKDVGVYFMQADLDPNDHQLLDVHYTYVQELLYLQGELDMQIIKIFTDLGDIIDPPDPEPEPSVFGHGIWDDNALWNDDHIWKDNP